MNCSLAQVILVVGSSDGDETIWMQMLVLIVLVALLGAGGLLKTRVSRFKEQQQDSSGYAGATHTRVFKGLKDKCLGLFLGTAHSKAVVGEPTLDFGGSNVAGKEKLTDEWTRQKRRDLDSGMEILELGFILKTVEKTESGGKNDVTIRKLGFNELARRGQLKAVGSSALKVYAINKGNMYGKNIQCEAMRELAERTGRRG